MLLYAKLAKGLSMIEVVAIVILFVGCWSIFSPVYRRHFILRDFQGAINELSFLKEKTSKFVSANARCPDEVGHGFPGAHFVSGYSLVVAPFGFSHGCLIRARFGSFSNAMLSGRLIELVGAQTSGSLLTWSCTTTASMSFLPQYCSKVPVIAFP